MTGLVLPWMLTIVMVALAGLHAYWGLGGLWPGTDQQSLARIVVGVPGIRRMPPPAACLAVSVVLLVVGLWPLLATFVVPTNRLALFMNLNGAGCMAVFLARGIAGYLPFWRRLHPEQPFADLDRRFYSPFCLALGIGFGVLLLEGISS